MIKDEKIKNSSELEFAVFCIENVAASSKSGIYRGREIKNLKKLALAS